MTMFINRKMVIVVALIIVLALALIVNNVMQKQRDEMFAETAKVTEEKILGEATLVDGGEGEGEVSVEVGSVSSRYFADARVNRQQARDEAIEVLQGIIDSTETDDDTRREAATELGNIATIMDKESAMETLIKAKGFEDAVVVVGEEDVTVVVSSKGLTAGEISKIKEVVMSETTAKAANIKIIEVS
ncbi:MAG TPA: SpoIIIAH-like family protein [Candidatus Acidoferrum sp.]|nr:SpoIIIAH-like family protein [Candidatus Acidoferrum sp.]